MGCSDDAGNGPGGTGQVGGNATAGGGAGNGVAGSGTPSGGAVVGSGASSGGDAAGLHTGGVGGSGGSAGLSASGGTTPDMIGGGGGSGGAAGDAGAHLKPRLVVLTDISSWETDDHESLTRLMAHADLFEIEGVVVSNGYSYNTVVPKFIDIARGVIDAYEKDLPNLLERSEQVGTAHDDGQQPIGYWPSPKYLRERTMFGSLTGGVNALGSNNDSPGSKLIIDLADETNDDRPIWVTAWGAASTLAQAIWRVKNDRSPEQLKEFLHKLRAFAITDQDRGAGGSTHPWMRTAAGRDLLFIWDECSWGLHYGTGKNNWNDYATHIQGHGALGAQYPKYTGGVEGDTPSFLFLMPSGLNDPNVPSQCSWGGTYKGDADNLWKGASTCGMYDGRFFPVAFKNFAARMDWAQSGSGNRNPVLVLDGDGGPGVVTKTPSVGTQVTLDVSKTFDPDGDQLKFSWWVQADAGSYTGKIDITNDTSNSATIDVPADSHGKTFHVICEVTDDGTHNLSSYRRIIFTPQN